jgi:hypothetical protein
MAVFMQPIYTQTVGAGGAGSITFNNIPQGFTDLKVVISARTTLSGFDNLMLRFNGDTTVSNYSTTGMYGNGSINASERVLNFYTFSFAPGSLPNALSTASAFGNLEAYIANYSSGNLKQIMSDNTAENNVDFDYVRNSLGASAYRSSTPITSISVFSFGNMAQHTTVTLYGISNTYDTAIPTAPTIGTVTDQAGFVSVAFTPASNDQAESYVVTSNPSGSTTYGQSSPIRTPAVLDTSYTYRVASVNALGTGQSSASSSITTSNSYTSIATVTVPSGTASSLAFNNIPQNYKHLQIRVYGIAPSANTNYFSTINGSGFGNYARHHVLGNGSATSSGGVANDAPIFYFTNATASTTFPFVSIIDILDYTDTTKFTTARAISGRDLNGSGDAGLYSWYWNSFAPVTSISLDSFATNQWSQFSHAALYGIA